MDRWYVVMTASSMEEESKTALKAMSFLTFLPMVQRRGSELIKPLFPHYMFIKTTMTARRWHMVMGAEGVRKMLGPRGKPMPVKEGVVEGVIALVGDDCVLLESAEVLMRKFRPGQQLEVIEGMFQGVTGTCTWVDKSGVRMEINPLLGRGMGLYVPLEYLQEVHKQPDHVIRSELFAKNLAKSRARPRFKSRYKVMARAAESSGAALPSPQKPGRRRNPYLRR